MFTNPPKIPDTFKFRAVLTCPTAEEAQIYLQLLSPLRKVFPIQFEIRSETEGFYDRMGY